MRDKQPFGYIGYGQNFLEINAKLTLRGADGNAVYEAPFLFHDKFKSFVPQFAPFKWEEVKEIEVLTEVEYKIVALDTKLDHLGSGTGHYKFAQTWEVKYGKDGVVLHSSRMKDLGSKGDGDFAVQIHMEVTEPVLEADSASVLLMLRLAGGGKDDGISVGYGPVQKGILQKAGVRSKDYEFKVDFFAIGRPREPEVIDVPDDLLTHDVWFAEDEPEMSTEELRRLEQIWSDPMRVRAPRLVEAIQSGKCAISLTGYASVTGRSKQYNLTLSAKRISSVAGAIKKTFKSQKIANVNFPLGQSTATQPGPAAQERRVEIVIERANAKAALSTK